MSDANGAVGAHQPPLFGRRHILMGGAMLAASGLAVARQPRPYAPRIDKERFRSWVPDVVGPWTFTTASGVVLPPPDDLSDRTYDNLISRVYEGADVPAIMLVIAYNNTQDGVLQIHRPEICYPVGGYALSSMRSRSVALAGRNIPVTMFSATGPDRSEQVFYWTRVGTSFPSTWAEQRMAVAKANIAGGIPDGALLRLSLIGDGLVQAQPQLERFARDFLAASPESLDRVLLGHAV